MIFSLGLNVRAATTGEFVPIPVVWFDLTTGDELLSAKNVMAVTWRFHATLIQGQIKNVPVKFASTFKKEKLPFKS